MERHGTTQSIVEFVETAAHAIPREERVAVFDNDGTLWSERPMPIELGFILQRLATMAEEDASLREKQPWKAAHEKDYAWLGGVIDKHYAGDDSDVKVLTPTPAVIMAAARSERPRSSASRAAIPLPKRLPLRRGIHRGRLGSDQD